ncbi:MAG: hypothetical protein ACMXYK_04500 [Candidatus Woesearchaeota archaeon]
MSDAIAESIRLNYAKGHSIHEIISAYEDRGYSAKVIQESLRKAFPVHRISAFIPSSVSLILFVLVFFFGFFTDSALVEVILLSIVSLCLLGLIFWLYYYGSFLKKRGGMLYPLLLLTLLIPYLNIIVFIIYFYMFVYTLYRSHVPAIIALIGWIVFFPAVVFLIQKEINRQ